MQEDGTVLDDEGTTPLTQLGLTDLSVLTLVSCGKRDYSKIKAFEKVKETERYPNGVLVTNEGQVVVCHYAGIISKYEPGTLDRSNSHGKTKLGGSSPSQMAFAPDGDLLVSFSAHPNTVRRYSWPELQPKPLLAETATHWYSRGLAVSADGRLFVSDTNRDRVVVYAYPSGDRLGEVGAGLLRHPCGLAVAADGTLAVADRRNGRVALFRPRTAGGAEEEEGGALYEHVRDVGGGDAPTLARLREPNDVCHDADGNLLVMDTLNERVAAFTPEGELIASIMPGFFKNHGNTYSYIACNQDTGAIVVSNNDEHTIASLAPLLPTAPASDA